MNWRCDQFDYEFWIEAHFDNVEKIVKLLICMIARVPG